MTPVAVDAKGQSVARLALAAIGGSTPAITSTAGIVVSDVSHTTATVKHGLTRVGRVEGGVNKGSLVVVLHL